MKFSTIIILTALLTASGQLANTIFVPAMGLMALYLNVNPASIQGFIAGYLLPYGLSQFIYGPLADRYGRRPIVLIGIIIFMVGALISATATMYGLVLLGCILQGTGAGVGGMMFRTIMRDCFTGDKLQKANSIMTMAVVFAPLLAPIIGSALAVTFGWRAIFYFLFIFSIVLFFIECKFLKETKPKVQHPLTLWNKYKMLFKEKSFIPYTIILALIFGGIAVFEASLGIILGQIFKLNPEIISLLFILPCPFFFIGSYAAGRMSSYIQLNKIIFIGILIAFVSALCMLIPGLFNFINLIIVILPLCFFMLSAGLLAPTATTGAIDPLGFIAGTAGAAIGGIQNIGAGICTTISSLIPQTTQIPLALILTILSFISLLIFLFMIRHKGFAHMEQRELPKSDFI